MAKPRRKTRRHKHRGTQAGTVERPQARPASGRTMTKEERQAEARRRRAERLDREPTWRSAFNRAALAAVVFAILAYAVLDQPPLGALMLGAFMLLIYVPLGYGFDRAIWRWRMRRRGGPPNDGAAGRGRRAR